MGRIKGNYHHAQGDYDHTQARDDTARFLSRVREQTMQREAHKKADRPPLGPIAIRPMCIDDASYVLDSWATSYRRSPTTGPIDVGVFNIEQRARIDRLFRRPSARIFVACDKEKPERIKGWICFEAPFGDMLTPIVHYVCVKPGAQLCGIGTALVGIARQTHTDKDAPMWSTHETAPMRHIRERWGLLYNPYLLEIPDASKHRRNTTKEVTL